MRCNGRAVERSTARSSLQEIFQLREIVNVGRAEFSRGNVSSQQPLPCRFPAESQGRGHAHAGDQDVLVRVMLFRKSEQLTCVQLFSG